MNLKQSIPGGLVDSALASLATFAVGLQAVRVLDAASLGGYALLFAAFNALSMVAARLVFLPAEIEAAKQPRGSLLPAASHSVGVGATLAVVAGLFVAPVAFTVPSDVHWDVVVLLTATAVLCTMLSPIQDHIRRMLHIGGLSWAAAVVSGVQLTTAAAAIAILTITDVSSAWQPFGALAAANLVSGLVGLAIWRRHSTPRAEQPIDLGALVRAGKWLLLAGMVPHLSGLGAAWLVAYLASAQALGYAEAARILARPIAVLSVGLKSVFGPELMRAGARRDLASARRFTGFYTMAIVACGIVYLLVAGFDTAWNPFPALMPTAYVIWGLVAATIAVHIIDRVAGAGATLQLMGAGRARGLAAVETVGGIGQVLAGFTAPFALAFAIPISYLVGSSIRQAWLQVLVRRLYAGEPPQVETVEPPTVRAEPAVRVEPTAPVS